MRSARAAVGGVAVCAALLGGCWFPEEPGGDPILTITPDPYVFAGNGPVNQVIEVEVHNDGGPASGLDFSFTDPVGNDLALSVAGGDCGTSLGAGDSCALQIRVQGTVSQDDTTGRIQVIADLPDPFPDTGYSSVFEVDLILV